MLFIFICSLVRQFSPSLLAIQDSFLVHGKPPRAPGFISLFDSSSLKPRVVFYLHTSFAERACFSLNTFNSPHLLGITFTSGSFLLRVLNVYNLP